MSLHYNLFTTPCRCLKLNNVLGCVMVLALLRISFDVISTKIFPEMNFKPNGIPRHDYTCFPCAEELRKQSYRPCVRTIEPRCGIHYQNCSYYPLKMANMSVCAHHVNHSIISRWLQRNGGFEIGMLESMISVLKSNPDMILFDIGCNIGLYTLVAAQMSRRVVCIDANYLNLEFVHRTLTMANLEENVTLVWNALSHTRGVGNLSIAEKGVGLAAMDTGHMKRRHISEVVSVEIIRLDELELLAKGKPVFMKMDVEHYEWNILQGGRQFFKNVDVRYVQMEFDNKNTRVPIAEFLEEYNLTMCLDVNGNQRVKIDEVSKLKVQDNAYFIKTGYL